MIALETLLVAAVLTGAGDTVLLDFTMDGCGGCVQMESTVQRLKQAGYPVRKVNLTHSPMWARHYQVDRAPTFLMLAGGREVDRVVGPTSYSRLQQMFDKAGFGVAKGGTPSRQPARPQSSTRVASRQQSPEQAALNATVRIKVDDASGSSYGTGTIVDVHGNEALVITCGHLFRDSGGQGRVSVDLYSDGQHVKTVLGTLLTFDADHRDIAALIVRPGMKVEAAKVPPKKYRSRVGAAVFSIGCDHGAHPSIRRSQVTALDKYAGPPNIEAAGHPVNGRSGGGLFSEDGMLIGVCNAADLQDDEGLYAALATIQWQLDKINQSSVYQENLLVRDKSSHTQTLASTASHRDIALRDPPKMPNHMPDSPLSRSTIPVSPRPNVPQARPSNSEIIVIIRPKDNSYGGETIVLPNPSPELMRQLREHNSAASQTADRRAAGQLQYSAGQQQFPERREPVIRAQSD